ncbi:type IV secretory pathway TrbL component [Lysinibacillus composti]|uniref:DUF2892 domain-containing protein n=1 Tax=Lysinibacillus composti TaxID=720633 RepID=A0A3N9UG45_9BACI|nr:DUF2892 domain-containing protein [Lysinibacillus composti]MBM7608036.1 type IV secretory pathway TrbL component [Lysinibacillus composti]RQW75114.1 DUF2892 domain-containing protein [Lysinibacillus composti]
MLEENISERSGFVRLALGAGITACGIAHLARENSSRTLGSLLVTAGALKIAEGIFLHCPAKALVSRNINDAVSTSFENFLDGDSLMQAFRDTYANTSSQNGGGQSTSAQGQSSSGSSTQGGLAQVVSAAAQGVQSLSNSSQSKPSNTTNSSQDALTQAANKAAKTIAGGGSVEGAISKVASSVAGSQNNQNKSNNNQNKQNNQKNNNNNKNNAINPS